MDDWRIFRGTEPPDWKPVPAHDDLARLPPPPPWRRAPDVGTPIKPAVSPFELEAETIKGAPIRLKNNPDKEKDGREKDNVVMAVNAALYLRRRSPAACCGTRPSRKCCISRMRFCG
jgi:hypothetical protein